jgi:hypothetical protein
MSGHSASEYRKSNTYSRTFVCDKCMQGDWTCHSDTVSGARYVINDVI